MSSVVRIAKNGGERLRIVAEDVDGEVREGGERSREAMPEGR